MAAHTYPELAHHVGHEIVCVYYGGRRERCLGV